MKQWTGAQTSELVMKSYLWLVGVTAPATAVIAWLVASIPAGSFVDSINTGLWLFIVFVFLFALIALGGALVAAPFTHLLGRTLRRVRSRLTHVLAHAALAGALAATSMQVLLLMFEDDPWSWQYPLLVSAPAGIAAAIARWRLDIIKPAPTVRYAQGAIHTVRDRAE